jgi:fumarylacetoacetase
MLNFWLFGDLVIYWPPTNPQITKSTNKKMVSWYPIAPDSDFSIHNLPYGVFSTVENPRPRLGIALGDAIIDVAALEGLGFLKNLGFDGSILHAPVWNPFMEQGKAVWGLLRGRLQEILCDAGQKERVSACFVAQTAATMHLPIQVGDYTDFYSSEAHATNVGKMFRDPANALLPNWKHLPVAYHGRASSIFIGGTNFQRPQGQIRPNDAEPPIFAPTRALDFELEVAAVIGTGNAPGEPIPTGAAEDHVFGFVLFNDWSARDIQRWEYVPLGPFLAKNFFSSISPWIVSLHALEPFRTEGPVQSPEVLPYLQFSGNRHFDLTLEVSIQPQGGMETRVCRTNFKYLYWNVCQQIAHHTVNGCNLRPGDLLASGTISGEAPDSFGSMLELSWGGKNPVKLSNIAERTYILDGDSVILRGFSEQAGIRVGFGALKNTVLPRK